MTWSSFLAAAAPSQHAVQVYDDVDDFAVSVARFVDEGVRAGEPAIVIATEDHWQRFAQELEVRREEFVTYRNAEQTLASFMEDGLPSRERFRHAVGGLVDEVAERFPGKTIRAVGEMVDILWRDGRERAAIALEELWNELAQTRRFALLCGYRLDIFDHDVQKSALPDVFGAHTHVRPSADGGTLSAALDEALDEVVDPLEAAHIYLDVAAHVPREKIPHAQAVLGWLSATGNADAPKILERTRGHYLRLRGAENPA